MYHKSFRYFRRVFQSRTSYISHGFKNLRYSKEPYIQRTLETVRQQIGMRCGDDGGDIPIDVDTIMREVDDN